MNTRAPFVLVLLVIGIVLSACGPSPAELDATATQASAHIFATQTAQAPTATPTSTPNPTPTARPSPTTTPELRLEDFSVEMPFTCQAGPLNLYSPLTYAKDTGKIDGRRFYEEAETLTGSHVEISGKVVEAQYYADPNEYVGGTLVLVLITADSGDIKYYAAVIFLPDDGGLGVTQYLAHSEIEASGVHLGLIPTPKNLFTWFPNKEG